MPLWQRKRLYQDSIHVNTASRDCDLIYQLRRLINSHSEVEKKLYALALS